MIHQSLSRAGSLVEYTTFLDLHAAMWNLTLILDQDPGLVERDALRGRRGRYAGGMVRIMEAQ